MVLAKSAVSNSRSFSIIARRERLEGIGGLYYKCRRKDRRPNQGTERRTMNVSVNKHHHEEAVVPRFVLSRFVIAPALGALCGEVDDVDQGVIVSWTTSFQNY
jgi:hypothetical protein